MRKSQSPNAVVSNCIERVWHFTKIMKPYLDKQDERSAWEADEMSAQLEMAIGPAWRKELADVRETLARLEQRLRRAGFARAVRPPREFSDAESFRLFRKCAGL